MIRMGIRPLSRESNGGSAEFIRISDLPEPKRIAFYERQADKAGLLAGQHDDDAHAAYLAAKPKAREEAERRAGIVRLVPTATWENGCAWCASGSVTAGPISGPFNATLKPSNGSILSTGTCPVGRLQGTDHLGRGVVMLHDDHPRCLAGLPAAPGMAGRARHFRRERLGIAVLRHVLSAVAGSSRVSIARGAPRSRGSGEAVDPALSLPALAFDKDGALICEGIAAVEAGDSGSMAGERAASNTCKAARKATAEARNAYLEDAAFDAALANLDFHLSHEPEAAPAAVVAAHFNPPLRDISAERQKPTAEIERLLRKRNQALDFDPLALRAMGKDGA
ncbi:hypothetical protein [Palleronia sp.]|uniref:hypothetical protein n=1 Tax=Palleronia sp. TaxID=1940284 RepID=UPI0035C7D223